MRRRADCRDRVHTVGPLTMLFPVPRGPESRERCVWSELYSFLRRWHDGETMRRHRRPERDAATPDCHAPAVSCGASAAAVPAETRAQASLEPRPGTELAAAFEEPWRWAQFTTTPGLPSNSVYDLVETSAGTIWAATHRGMAWFDGYQWNPVGAPQGIPAQLPEAVAPSLTTRSSSPPVVACPRRRPRGIPADRGLPRWQLIQRRDHHRGCSRRGVRARRGGSRGHPRGVDLRRRIVPMGDAEAAPVPGDHDAVKLWSNGAGSLWLTTGSGLQRWEDGAWEQFILLHRATGDVSVYPCSSRRPPEQGLASIAHPARARGIWEWHGDDLASPQPRRTRRPVPVDGHLRRRRRHRVSTGRETYASARMVAGRRSTRYRRRWPAPSSSGSAKTATCGSAPRPGSICSRLAATLDALGGSLSQPAQRHPRDLARPRRLPVARDRRRRGDTPSGRERRVGGPRGRGGATGDHRPG